jgi:cytosine/adenosine deaminase-related metal-dependent hydrolase
VDAVVFAAGAGDVDTVVSGGEVIVRGGRHLYVDVAAELAAVIE